MSQNQRISQLQQKNTILRDEDLFYVSEKQKYGNYISKHISYGKTIESIRSSLSDEIDLLNDINENYLDDRQVSFTFNKTTNNLEFDTGLQVLSVDVSDFIESGMIEKVEYKKPHLIITFRVSGGGTREVKIDISDIVVLEEGHAIKIDGKKISVDPETISSDLTNIFSKISLVSSVSSDLNTKIDNSITSLTSLISSVSVEVESKIPSYSEISVGINLSDYSKIGHTHTVSEIIDITSNYYDKTQCETNFLSSNTFIPSKTSELNNDAKLLSAEDFKMEYSQSDSKLSLSVGSDKVLTAEIQSGGTGGVTYNYVKNNLSSDGYGLKVVFKDWKYS